MKRTGKYSLTVGLLALAGCGAGPGFLLSGLVADSIIDGLRDEDGEEDGIHCWDWFDQQGECDEEEDTNEDGFCDALDCRGSAGIDGTDGEMGEQGPQGEDGGDGADSTVSGPAGPQGLPGLPGAPIVIVLPPVGYNPTPTEDEDDPPHGHAYGHDDPPGNSHKPDKPSKP